MLVTVLARLDGLGRAGVCWYGRAMDWGEAASPTAQNPEAAITREQLAVMPAGSAGAGGPEESALHSFPHAGRLSDGRRARLGPCRRASSPATAGGLQPAGTGTPARSGGHSHAFCGADGITGPFARDMPADFSPSADVPAMISVNLGSNRSP